MHRMGIMILGVKQVWGMVGLMIGKMAKADAKRQHIGGPAGCLEVATVGNCTVTLGSTALQQLLLHVFLCPQPWVKPRAEA